MFGCSLLYKPACSYVSTALYQGRLEFAFAQVVVMRHFHHHKALRAAHGDDGFCLPVQGFFHGGDTAHFEVIGVQIFHAVGCRLIKEATFGAIYRIVNSVNE